MKRIYVAGPCTGVPDLNFPAFHAEAARLRALGYDVVSPAEINGDAAPTSGDHFEHWARCMALDIPHLLTCDTVAFLPGFLNSSGSFVELFLANAFRITKVLASEITTGPAA